MMKRWFILIAALLTASSALAQQSATPLEQALWVKLLRETSEGVQCNVGATTVQQELASAKVRIKALEDKYEPLKKPE